MTTPDKLKELEDIVIDFNEYLETVAAGLENLETGVKAIVENIRVEIEELSKGTEDVISGMKHDLEQGRTVVAEMLKTLSTTKSSPSPTPTTVQTESTAKPATPQTEEPSSSTPFLEKEKEMLELKAKLLAKRTRPGSMARTVTFDLCDPFISEYRRITELAYGKLNTLSQIFYSGGRSLFARLTACPGANPELIYHFYSFGYLDIVYPDKNLTELSYFPVEMKSILKTFRQKPIFVKFHTIPPEKDAASGTQYPAISLIQVGYVTENFELNIEATKKFEPFRFNESWMNYRRTSGAFAVKCQGDRLYTSGLRTLYREANFIVITKENIQPEIFDDDLLKFLFQLEPGNFKGSPAVVKKFAELIQKEEDKRTQLQMAKILPP